MVAIYTATTELFALSIFTYGQMLDLLRGVFLYVTRKSTPLCNGRP